MRRLVLLFGRCLPLGFALSLALAVGAPLASAEPPQTHEILQNRPSGFWTSNRPAEGGAYRWRMLGVGIVFLGVTGILMLRLVKRANADRANADRTARR